MRLWRFAGRARVVDGALAGVLVLIPGLGLLSAALLGPLDTAPGAALFLLAALPLLVRRSRPVYTATTAVALDVAGTLTVTPAVIVVAVVALYSLARYAAGRTALLTGSALAAAYGAAQVAEHGLNGLSVVLIYLLALGAGFLVRNLAELRERREREEAEAAVHAERRRIARELHDVVAHHLSVLLVLVGGARAVWPAEQPEALDALRAAEQTSRQALAEMRKLLHVLRADENGPPAGAAGLGTLVEQARAAGLSAGVEVRGEPVPLPAPVDLAVYRIVQEALTNTRKHAPGARARVRLSYLEDAVEVEVLDDGRGAEPGVSGYGLRGMAERVALCGGSLETGSPASGGFRVLARLPLT
ncbi:histidine kinase [Nonomuraea sp. NPDC050310]|uniref:sensor histidine kinase n=1 Tax=unclassified Nonomuraea TaxID=2593643 RepID=UPI0033E59676